MKGFLKVLFITVAVIVLIITAAIATLPLWLPAGKLKNMLANEIAIMTGRDVEINELSFNIFKGIELKNVSIKESARYKKRNFIQDKEIILKYNLFAIISGNLVINQFELNSPYVEVIKEAGGRFNYTDILEYMADKKAAKNKSNSNNTQPEKKNSFIKNIIITGVAIKNGYIQYADYSKAKPLGVKVEKLNFSMDDIMSGLLKPIGMSADCIILYSKYVIPISMKTEVKLDLVNKSADMKIPTLVIAGIDSTGDIKITSAPYVKGHITTAAGIEKLLKILPSETTAKMKDIKLDMAVSNEVNFTYQAGKFKFTNITGIEKGTVAYKDKKVIEDLKGTVSVDENYDMKGLFNMQLTGNEVKINMSGSDVNSMETGKIKMDVYSPKFAMEYMLAMFPKKSTATANTTQAKAKKNSYNVKKKEVASLGLTINLKADSVYYKDVVFGKTISSIRINRGKLYSETAMNAYEGSINVNVIADANTENYTCDAIISRVKIHEFVDDAITVMPRKESEKDKKTLMDDMKDKVYGSFSMTSQFFGNTFKDMVHTIKGKGDFVVTGGKLSALKIGKDLADKTGAKFLSQDIPFDVLSSNFDMQNGRINVKNFKMYNGKNGNEGDIKVTAAGWTSVDRTLDFSMKCDFSPEIGRQIQDKFASSLSIKDAGIAYNKDGWLPFDFRVYNTVADKKYDFSQTRLVENIKRNMGKKIEDTGRKYIEEKATGLIKSLFGK